MPRCFAVLIIGAGCLIPVHSQKSNPFLGRWDIEVSPTAAHTSSYPDWMEVTDTGMRIQPKSGGAFAVTDFKISGSRLTINWPHSDAKAPAVTWEIDITDDRINGTERRNGTVSAYLSGSRAPALDRKPPVAWSDPHALFNGKDLAGWEPMGSTMNQWAAKDGELLNQAAGANLRTSRTFNDFKLHIEFNCP